jgi:hypothetical protein
MWYSQMECELKNMKADPPSETAEIGTPLDYGADAYRVYFEVRDPTGMARQIIDDFLGGERAKQVLVLAHGYEMELPIQCVPEIVRLLAAANIAVYQVVRYAKTNAVWA